MSGTADDNKNQNPNPNVDNPGGDDEGKNGNPPGDQDGGGEGGEDLEGLSPEDMKKVIAKLRKENGKHRTTNNNLKGELDKAGAKEKALKVALGLEDDSETPEQKAAKLQADNEALQVENGLLQIKSDLGITKDQDPYFRFLIAQRFEKLGEGEELDDAALEEIKAQVNQAVPAGAKQTSTGVTTGKKPAGGGGGTGATAEQFAKMTNAERTELYDKNPELYESLLSEVRAKKLLR